MSEKASPGKGTVRKTGDGWIVPAFSWVGILTWSIPDKTRETIGKPFGIRVLAQGSEKTGSILPQIVPSVHPPSQEFTEMLPFLHRSFPLYDMVR
jgi:hypothetical protein